jgi:hypothetical protein
VESNENNEKDGKYGKDGKKRNSLSKKKSHSFEESNSSSYLSEEEIKDEVHDIKKSTKHEHEKDRKMSMRRLSVKQNVDPV